jgi:hypothetical protein
MLGFDQRRLLKEIFAAVAGRRALFYPGWSGMDTASLPVNFLVVGDTPHSWLFPQTSLVVHHGGSGTAHSAARAIEFAETDQVRPEGKQFVAIAVSCLDECAPYARRACFSAESPSHNSVRYGKFQFSGGSRAAIRSVTWGEARSMIWGLKGRCEFVEKNSFTRGFVSAVEF